MQDMVAERSAYAPFSLNRTPYNMEFSRAIGCIAPAFYLLVSPSRLKHTHGFLLPSSGRGTVVLSARFEEDAQRTSSIRVLCYTHQGNKMHHDPAFQKLRAEADMPGKPPARAKADPP